VGTFNRKQSSEVPSVRQREKVKIHKNRGDISKRKKMEKKKGKVTIMQV